MKVTKLPKKAWKNRRDFPFYCRYIWNRLVRRFKIDGPPIFIVGCGHSGTSILLAILGTHSRIWPVPKESYMAAKADPVRFYKKKREFDIAAIANKKYRWVEKTPKHVREIGNILNWQPNAKIIVVIRDGRDVAQSLRERSGTLEDGIKRWVKDNEKAIEYQNSANVCFIKYEDIVADFEPSLRRLMGFLGEKYEVNMEHYHEIERRWYHRRLQRPPKASGIQHEQYRNWQINQPLFDGRGRWKKMTDEELAFVNKIGEGMLRELGYPIGRPPCARRHIASGPSPRPR